MQIILPTYSTMCVFIRRLPAELAAQLREIGRIKIEGNTPESVQKAREVCDLYIYTDEKLMTVTSFLFCLFMLLVITEYAGCYTTSA